MLYINISLNNNVFIFTFDAQSHRPFTVYRSNNLTSKLDGIKAYCHLDQDTVIKNLNKIPGNLWFVWWTFVQAIIHLVAFLSEF